jgi:gas vesicle protein
LVGAAAGAVLGWLFAPSKGRDLRQKIKDNTGDLMDELTVKIKEGKGAFIWIKVESNVKFR